jgi:hypothetical protein
MALRLKKANVESLIGSNMFERKFEELIAELDSATAQALRELYATATNLQKLELIVAVADHLETEVIIGK